MVLSTVTVKLRTKERVQTDTKICQTASELRISGEFFGRKTLTMSVSHTISSDLDLKRLSFDRDVVYEPELFPSLNFKRKGVNFCCFHTGKVVITGVTSPQQEDEVVCPTLIELELYTRKKE